MAKEKPSFTLPRMRAPFQSKGAPNESGGFGHPERDWRRIFYGFVIFNLLMIGVHVFLYYMMTSGAFFAASAESTQEIEVFDTEKLNTVIGHFQTQEEELHDRLADPVVVPEVR